MTAASSWELDPEHEEFRASVRAFVDRPVRPVVEESEQDGGGGGDSLAVCVLSEELARASGGIAITALVTGYHDVTSQLGGYARLGAVYLTSALPKTRTGKTMRRLLRDVVEHGAPQGDTSAMEDTAGLQALQQAVAADAKEG